MLARRHEASPGPQRHVGPSSHSCRSVGPHDFRRSALPEKNCRPRRLLPAPSLLKSQDRDHAPPDRSRAHLRLFQAHHSHQSPPRRLNQVSVQPLCPSLVDRSSRRLSTPPCHAQVPPVLSRAHRSRKYRPSSLVNSRHRRRRRWSSRRTLLHCRHGQAQALRQPQRRRDLRRESRR